MATTLNHPTPLVPEADESPAPHRWTYDEYVRIHEAGVFGEGVRTELIDGRIYIRMPQKNAHIIAVQLVFRALQAVFGEGFNLAMSLPMKMEGDSPEPDVRILRGEIEDYDGRAIEATKDVALVVEVSDTTLAFDRRTKVRLYAHHGISEYWIVNLRERTLEVRRRPFGEDYAETVVYRGDESVAVGEATVAVASLLPKADGL